MSVKQNLWSWRELSNELPITLSKQQLTYELSQIVFEYMDTNFRIHLSANLPPLRSAEKGTHLKINELMLTSNCIFIDKTKYLLSIVDDDVDEFEFKKFPDITKNGDVCMENYNIGDEDDEESGHMAAMKIRQLSKCGVKIKLTIVSENRERWIYTSSKTTKVHEGMKMLIGVIFGNRTVIWNVESMIISTANLRWIVSGVKPLCRNIRLEGYHYVNLDGLRSICHQTSFPLKTLDLEIDYRILDHEILVNAEHLLIHTGVQRFNISFMYQLNKVTHRKVQIFCILPTFFAYFMDLWLDDGKPVGTSWSFRVQDTEPSEYIDVLKGNAQVIESDHPSNFQWVHPPYYPYPMIIQNPMLMVFINERPGE